MVLLSGSTTIDFAQSVASQMNLALGKIESSSFSNGERKVYVQEPVKGKDVALFQSFSDPVDSSIIEFALITDALIRMGAHRVFGVVPWFGYSLQDKVFRLGEPIAAKAIASMLCSQSIYRFIMMNLHNNSISGFFSVPTSVLSSDDIFASQIKMMNEEIVLVSSDFGGLKRVGKFAQKTGLPLANIDKRRDLITGEVTAHAMTGDVNGKTAIIIDDIINGGSTATQAAKILKQNGAKRIIMFATHAILAGDACERLQLSDLDEVVVTDTISTKNKNFAKLRVISVAKLFADELSAWVV